MSERNITYLTNGCFFTCIVSIGSSLSMMEIRALFPLRLEKNSKEEITM